MPVTFKHFINEEDLTPVSGTQYGSNPGGVHVDNKGNKHYVKYYKDGEQAKTEALTGKIYNHMGIKTLNPEYQSILIDELIEVFNNRLSILNKERIKRC